MTLMIGCDRLPSAFASISNGSTSSHAGPPITSVSVSSP
jgi:hypothetical protein